MKRDSAIRQREAPPGEEWMQWSGYGPELHRYFMNGLCNAQDARDLAQEVYLRLLRVDKLELVRDFRSYMYRIAGHVAYEYRHRVREPHVNFDSEAVTRRTEEEMDRPDELYDHLSSKQELQRMLERLSPVQRAIVVLHMGLGFSCDQIAERLRLSRHTVKKYLTRAIAKLRHEEWNADTERRRS